MAKGIIRLAQLGALPVAVLLCAAVAAFIRPDLSRASLIAKYADPKSQFVTLPDGTIAHVRIEGTAGMPVIVLLHGAASSLQTWDKWTPELAKHYEVVSLDLPGHGLTGPTVAADYSRDGMVSFVHAALAKLGVRREAIIGHSMGGGVAVAFAEQHPEEVWALVLMDASGIPRTKGQGSGLDRIAHNPFLRPLLRWATPRWVIARGIRKTFADPSKASDRLLDRIYDLLRFPGNRAALIGHYLANDNDVQIQDQLRSLMVPTLILWGEADRLLPPSHAGEFQRRISGAQLIVYAGIGHTPQEEAPEQSLRDVANFLAARRL
jgi:pimeloyl-ACP methyl ester carboxylesterase